ncbi:MAG: ATP-binding protein [Methylococcaceae bacterium]|nr:MAG: ATP-binding protein [Methylococcaceae bacterium]
MRYFNTAGPSVPGQHYMIDPLQRLDLPDVEALIDQQRYFVLHAPRQTGKTSCLLALMQHLNAQGRYIALYANIEAAQAVRGDVGQGVETILEYISQAAQVYLEDERLHAWQREVLATSPASGALSTYLQRWARFAGKPIVLMLDEVDALVGDTLISLLRQLRAGYAQRPAAFPQSVILCGVRDVRDYRIHTGNQEIITGGSAFNIKAESLRLGNFSRAEAVELFRQHTADTGQTFAPEIFDELWQDTQGQPWLVNAMGYELTWKDKSARDRGVPITLEHYNAARERLIYSRATHLDQLTDKLKEDRVHRVMAPLLRGEEDSREFRDDDLQYVEDLGLIRRKPEVVIANRIYRETIPRELTSPIQDGLHQPTAWYVTLEHRLDVVKLLTAFQQFFREHVDAWLERFDYKEAGPQLLLQAFLQRVVNGGGRVNREYGLGRRRTDLFLEWPLDETQGYHGPVQRVVIELKLLHKSLEQTLAQGLEQTADYADRCGADEAHLLIFDRRPEVSWEEKIWRREASHGGRNIVAWGA